MRKVIDKPRESLSPYAPMIINMMINPDKIREVIGTGGKVINKIIDETGVKIDIDNDGKVSILSNDQEMCMKAKAIIEGIVAEPEIGKIYSGKITKIMQFGAFVEILPGKEGLLHISQMDKQRVAKVEDLFKEGDSVEVKLTEIDSQGRLNLSRKVLL